MEGGHLGRGGNGNGGTFGFVAVFLFPVHNSLAGACGAGLTKPPQSAWSPAGLLSASLLCVFLPTIQLGPATGFSFGQIFLQLSLNHFEGRRVRWV